MTEKSPEPKTPLSDQLADALLKLLFVGSGGSSLFFLFKNDIPKALIAMGIAGGTSLLTSFWDGLLEILRTRMKERGQEVGKAIDRAVDLTLSGFKRKYLEVLKVECYTLEVEGHQIEQTLALDDVFVPLRIESGQTAGIISGGSQEIWEFLPKLHHSPSQYPQRRIVVLAGPGYGKTTLLLTMIATTHRVQTVLPKRRVELYETMCGLVLGTRPYAKKINITLTATENRAVLQVLAYQLMQQEKTQFTPEQGEQWIQDILTRCRKERDLSSKQFWEEMRDIAGLLVEKEADLYKFSHLTFQEYLAALQIKELGQEALLLEKLSNDRWQEVICFYASLGNATNLINAALDNLTPYTLNLANRCKNEGRDVDSQTLMRLELALLSLPLSELELAAEVRLEQRFRRLGIIDDYTAIAQGYITWGEYQLFLDAQATGQFHSQATLVQIDPGQLNQPVTGISWEDARWFCAWLGTLTNLQRTDEAGNGVSDYRLPTEEELRRFPAREQGQLVALTDLPTSPGNALRVLRVQRPNRYKALLNYLANGRWREADEETLKVMLEVAGQKGWGYLKPEDIKQFPCEDLRIIDQLWAKFSGGRFGFSVQKQIFLETMNKPDGQYCEKEYEKFGDRVGWYANRKKQWLYLDDLNHTLNAPQGHLPCRMGCQSWDQRVKVGASLASRLLECSIQYL